MLLLILKKMFFWLFPLLLESVYLMKRISPAQFDCWFPSFLPLSLPSFPPFKFWIITDLHAVVRNTQSNSCTLYLVSTSSNISLLSFWTLPSTFLTSCLCSSHIRLLSFFFNRAPTREPRIALLCVCVYTKYP